MNHPRSLSLLRLLNGVEWGTERVLLAMLVAESAVLWLLTALIFSAPETPAGAISPLVIFVLVTGAAYTPRVLGALGIWHPTFETVMTLGIAITTLFAVKSASFPHRAWDDPAWLRGAAQALVLRPTDARIPVWGIVLVAAFTWWRGRHRSEPGLDPAYSLLRFGTPLMLLVAVGHSLAPDAADERAVSTALLIFFAATLTAIALLRQRQNLIQAQNQTRRPGASRHIGRWATPLVSLAGVAAVLGLALALASVASPEILETLLWILSPLLWVLWLLARIVLIAIALVVFIILAPLMWFLAGRDFRLPLLPSRQANDTASDQLRDEASRIFDVPDPIRYLVALGILLTLFGAVTRFALWRRPRAAPPPDEERSSIAAPRPRDILRRLAARLRQVRRAQRHSRDPLASLRGDPRWDHTIAIRETYGALLKRFAARGVPRQVATTPAEQSAALAPTLPEPLRADLALLTTTYASARYGAAPATAADADTARRAWRRIAAWMDDTSPAGH